MRVLLLLHHQLLTTWMIYETVTVWLHIRFCYFSTPISRDISKNYHSSEFEQQFRSLSYSCKANNNTDSSRLHWEQDTAMNWIPTPTEAMEWRHSAFPGMGKSSSLSSLIKYKYSVDFTTRSWWRVYGARTIIEESEWTLKFINIQLRCKNELTWYDFLSHLESVLKCVAIFMPHCISRKK